MIEPAGTTTRHQTSEKSRPPRRAGLDTPSGHRAESGTGAESRAPILAPYDRTGRGRVVPALEPDLGPLLLVVMRRRSERTALAYQALLILALAVGVVALFSLPPSEARIEPGLPDAPPPKIFVQLDG